MIVPGNAESAVCALARSCIDFPSGPILGADPSNTTRPDTVEPCDVLTRSPDPSLPRTVTARNPDSGGGRGPILPGTRFRTSSTYSPERTAANEKLPSTAVVTDTEPPGATENGVLRSACRTHI